MAIFKCKMCGGALEITGNESVIECEYCGTSQTLPKLDNEKRANLYDRANHFRRNNEFDKAMGIYEQILNEDNTDAEAYWSLVLCRYGIEYVEDPVTKKRVPTVNRAQFTSVFDDEDYKSAILNADGLQKTIYEAEAKTINEIQKGILEISGKEEPFDVFICYKESDNNGRRTPDSVLANDLYHQLTQEGFKVFFSRITLEDKLGSAYEPYIFAALNSSKVMVALGTRPEYFTAVWVKNEWSRYLALIKQGQKKMLIPAYKDMDPYDLPEEFSHLQAQDMAKLGFMQDLIRGIKKIVASDEPKATVVKETVVTESASANTAPLLRRMFMFLEDGEWNSANEYAEKVLDIEPECAEAYLGKLMAELQVRKKESLKDCSNPFGSNPNYNKAIRFGNDALKTELSGYIEFIKDRNEKARIEAERKAEEARKIEIYREAIDLMFSEKYSDAVEIFSSMPGYKDSEAKIAECKKKIAEIETQKEAERLEAERKAEEARILAEKRKKQAIKVTKIVTSIVCAVVAFIVLLNTIILPAVERSNQYKEAVALMESGDYENAVEVFKKLGDYKDSTERLYCYAVKLLEKEELLEAIEMFDILGVYKDSEKQSEDCREKIYVKALEKVQEKNFDEAIIDLFQLKGYKDSENLIQKNYIKGNLNGKIATGYNHSLGLKSDGTVVATGSNDYGECDVEDWKDIVAVTAIHYSTIGLKSDGTVVATGENDYGECNVGNWQNVVAIGMGAGFSLGVKSNGMVVATGRNNTGQCNVTSWRDIVAIIGGQFYTMGLKSDGTVVATGSNNYGECDVEDWKDIVAIAGGWYHVVGLKSDGTVVAAGRNFSGERDVEDWRDIVAVSAGLVHTVGLKSDGTVVATGSNDYGECDVEDWKDIVAVSATHYRTIGLKSDGTVVATGENDGGKFDLSGWDLF